ncbi:MAG: DUF6198 family protein [Clostridiales bacterium]|nr:DUF6198 family protein [Clostridiales bacterium]
MEIIMNIKEYVKRYFYLALGLFILSFGVALSTKANLGTSPISCVPYVLSLGFPLSMGTITALMHTFFIILQIIILRRDFDPVQLLQLLTAFVFGVFTDVSLFLVSGISLENIIARWILCIISCVVIAFGVNTEVKAGVLVLAGEGLILAISKKTGIEFGKCKVGFDCTLMACGFIFSMLLFGELNGIREGTLAAALLVGTFVRIINKKFYFIYEIMGIDKPLKSTLQ